MKIKDITEFIEEMAPISTQEEWDNSGIQVGNTENELKGILLSLDLSCEVLEYAADNGFNLIINHHPLIFNHLNKIDYNSDIGKKIYKTVKDDLTVYASHTPLDKMKNGVSYALAEKFNLKNISVLDEISSYGVAGNIDSINVFEFLEKVKTDLEMSDLIFYGDYTGDISKVSVMGGSGAFMINKAIENNSDVFITSDIKYHDGQKAVENGLKILDIGHYNSEKWILWKLKSILEEKFEDIKKMEIFEYKRICRKLI